MNNYFRITAYHPNENISAIFESNKYFITLYAFTYTLEKLGWEILSYAKAEEITNNNIPFTQENEDQIILRACMNGKCNVDNNKIYFKDKTYETT